MAIGENEKFEILEEGLLEPLNRACLTEDSYTREHSAEAIAELLTLAEIQVIVLLFAQFLLEYGICLLSRSNIVLKPCSLL